MHDGVNMKNMKKREKMIFLNIFLKGILKLPSSYI